MLHFPQILYLCFFLLNFPSSFKNYLFWLKLYNSKYLGKKNPDEKNRIHVTKEDKDDVTFQYGR